MFVGDVLSSLLLIAVTLIDIPTIWSALYTQFVEFQLTGLPVDSHTEQVLGMPSRSYNEGMLPSAST